MNFETIKRPLNLLYPVQVWLPVIFIASPLLNFLVPKPYIASRSTGLLDLSDLPFHPLASFLFSIPSFFIVFICYYFLCNRLSSIIALKCMLIGISIVCLFLSSLFLGLNNYSYRTFTLYSISIIISAILYNIPFILHKKQKHYSPYAQ